jgi:hypothetical protein
MKKTLGAVVFSAMAGLLSCGGDPVSSEATTESEETLAPAETAVVRVTCASQFFQRRECPVDTQGGRVVDIRIVNEFSNPPFLCRDDDSHGFTPNSVWVDHGCAAEMNVTIQSAAETRERIRCGSNDGRYHECPSTLDRIRRIRIVRQESSQPCEPGRTFGAFPDAVWVDRGCRGVFEVTGRPSSVPQRTVTLFDREDAQGNRFVVDGVIPNLADVGWNDRTESIVVRNGQWELCERPNFTGWCRTFGPGLYSDFGPLTGSISSVRPR